MARNKRTVRGAAPLHDRQADPTCQTNSGGFDHYVQSRPIRIRSFSSLITRMKQQSASTISKSRMLAGMDWAPISSMTSMINGVSGSAGKSLRMQAGPGPAPECVNFAGGAEYLCRRASRRCCGNGGRPNALGEHGDAPIQAGAVADHAGGIPV